MIPICCCCYLHLIIVVDFKMTSFNQFTIFTFPTLQAEGNSRCCSASLNPLTVCFHTKLIKDFLNREHAMKESSNSGFSVLLLYSAKYIVYSAISAFPTSENFKDKYHLPNPMVFQINRWLPLIKYFFFPQTQANYLKSQRFYMVLNLIFFPDEMSEDHQEVGRGGSYCSTTFHSC